ncbi:ABC transporter ATP-binding protein [Enterococcus timonensis]|uniref:ABC transporter ATP-binding protein n=1 Tax=Enterococcus timonensis TaxID=1852364 RepID=UPI0008D93411|nr:ABC transporter ATP-binding protein [Enterococcus timonensis]
MTLFQQLRKYVLEHKLNYTIVFIFMIISSAMSVAPTYILRLFIDAIVSKDFSVAVLTQYSSYFLLVIVLAYLADFIWSYYLFIGSYDLQKSFREKLMAHFLKMGAPFYHRFRTGDLLTRASEDVQVMGMTVGYGLMTLLNSSVFLAFVVGMMAITVSWQLTIIALLPMPILAYYIFKWGSQVDKKFTEAQDAVSQMNAEVLEIVDGLRVVRAFGLEGSTTKKFQEKTTATKDKNNEVSEIDSRFNPLITIVLAISFVLSFLGGAYLISQQKITVGAMVSFQVYLTMIVWPMISAGDLVNVMQQGVASFRRIYEVLSTGDLLEKEGTQTLAEVETITFEDFDFKYPEDTRLTLQQVDLTIKKGQIIGFVGKTGSGKTTLLRQFTHRYPYSSSVPLINGEKLTDYKTFDLRKQLAQVPQEHILFSRSIRENLLFGDENASDEKLLKSLQLASFDQEVLAMPQGLDTLVGEKGVSLSGGQKQRLSLARAFLRNSPILLLDDALSAVDAKTEAKIIENLKELPGDLTLLIVTHRLSAITKADQIFVLEDGAIVQRGTHESLIQTSGWYQDQYLHQQLKEDTLDV